MKMLLLMHQLLLLHILLKTYYLTPIPFDVKDTYGTLPEIIYENEVAKWYSDESFTNNVTANIKDKQNYPFLFGLISLFIR